MKASVEIELGKAPQLVSDFFDDLVRFSQSRGDGSYTDESAAEDVRVVLAEIEKALGFIAEKIDLAKRGVPSWHGSAILVVPLLNEREPVYNDEGEMRDFGSAEVYVDRTPMKMSPSFSMFLHGGKVAIDDVLDAGDSDFFQDDPETESDYFGLVNELRHPGRAARVSDKSIVLYTARPTKDRSMYENATSIPTNVFLTTSYDEAEGYSMDMGQRDIWAVRIKMKYLVETLDRGRLKNYQVVAPGSKVPVESIERA